MQPKKQSGLILGVVLILLFVFSLMGMSALDTAMQELQSVHIFSQSHSVFYGAECALKTGEEGILSPMNKQCLYKAQQSDYLLRMDASWWKAHGCKVSDGDTEQYYLAEDLGQFPCWMIGDKHRATIYRVSSFATNRQGQYPVRLQSTMAVKTLLDEECEGELKELTEGRLSWRQYVSEDNRRQ